jgi:hypothetical protein
MPIRIYKTSIVYNVLLTLDHQNEPIDLLDTGILPGKSPDRADRLSVTSQNFVILPGKISK